MVKTWVFSLTNPRINGNSCIPLFMLISPPSVWPHLFCGAGHEKRRGEQLKWSLAFRLYIGSFVFHVHSYQDQFIQPGWAECVFIFSLGLYFVWLYCFNLFVCLHPFVFPWAVESSPLQVGAGVTNLNEPPIAFATSTIPWVRS